MEMLLYQSNTPYKERAAARQSHRPNYRLPQQQGYDRRRRDQKAPRERSGPPASVVTDGTVISSSASAISVDNVGHRMLSKMGWSPGAGLGASEGGIAKPIEAVMKRSRQGLGHEQSSGSS
ncbi:G patch domain-containing protein 2 [Modicella reniformis]|uniref:G patch domain-containing protein 2 n=1 Tax=Modicella reniformis TaxID=1440133 RepID=A0A9P6IIT6_9FUNG|nr:G patch domain-containing protein 2 [Modicella reniformis]